MLLLDTHAPWLRHASVSDAGIVVGEARRFGIGAVLVVERRRTLELLFIRKAYRHAYEGNHQLAFPGGMVRPSLGDRGMTGWIHASLTARVAAEVNLKLPVQEHLTPLDGVPPVVAAYTARGKRRHTVILPFILTLVQEFQPRSHDATVYEPGWHVPVTRWHEITPTNRLIAAYYLWFRLSEMERKTARLQLAEALHQATAWAAEAHLPLPVASWLLPSGE